MTAANNVLPETPNAFIRRQNSKESGQKSWIERQQLRGKTGSTRCPATSSFIQSISQPLRVQQPTPVWPTEPQRQPPQHKYVDNHHPANA
ncbi:unnamed protein product [Enterobius vermicularis]|uniref:Uncharacterized protein n=1 Tax=Enterobius vermicularis TaxID=51028 RepID=A0A0N4V6L3_ENTVE|nr:unnamed protein product [Enterobius vermicularis]